MASHAHPPTVKIKAEKALVVSFSHTRAWSFGPTLVLILAHGLWASCSVQSFVAQTNLYASINFVPTVHCTHGLKFLSKLAARSCQGPRLTAGGVYGRWRARMLSPQNISGILSQQAHSASLLRSAI